MYFTQKATCLARQLGLHINRQVYVAVSVTVCLCIAQPALVHNHSALHATSQNGVFNKAVPLNNTRAMLQEMQSAPRAALMAGHDMLCKKHMEQWLMGMYKPQGWQSPLDSPC